LLLLLLLATAAQMIDELLRDVLAKFGTEEQRAIARTDFWIV